MRHRAQRKLQKEAIRDDNDLRLMVGHANLLDSLMMDLHLAEEEQEKRAVAAAKATAVVASEMVESGRLICAREGDVSI